jgi:hypothetical protein
MELTKMLYQMMIGSFLIQYFGMSAIMANSFNNITFSLGKFYISIIMALAMGLLEVAMFDFHMKTVNSFLYMCIIFWLIVFIYLYRNQVFIYDKDYLQEMIEHHSMAILTSEELLDKEPPKRVKKLAENIIQVQQKEIEYMKQLLQSM